MSNKISNDDSFQNYTGKYISLTQNGVTKKYFVSEIGKNSFLSNVSILQGTDQTNYSFTSAGVPQRCDACDFPCISAVPIIEMIFPGRGLSQNYYAGNSLSLQKPYFDEKHVPVINNHNIATIDLAVLSADFNIVWLIPSTEQYKIDVDDVFKPIIESSFPDIFTSRTTSFSAYYFNPSYYNDNGFNQFKIDHIYANNPLSSDFAIPEGYTDQWFWGYFFEDVLPTFESSRIMYKKLITDSTGSKTLTCYPWYLYSLTNSDVNPSIYTFYSKEFRPPFSPTFYNNSEHQQISFTFLDLNPCSPPVIEYYQYDNTKYYTFPDTHDAYIYYDSPFLPHPILRKIDFYTSCSTSSPVSSLYIGANKGRFGAGPWTSTIYYHNSAATDIVESARIYYTNEFYPGEIYYIDIQQGKKINGSTCT